MALFAGRKTRHLLATSPAELLQLDFMLLIWQTLDHATHSEALGCRLGLVGPPEFSATPLRLHTSHSTTSAGYPSMLLTRTSRIATPRSPSFPTLTSNHLGLRPTPPMRLASKRQCRPLSRYAPYLGKHSTPRTHAHAPLATWPLAYPVSRYTTNNQVEH